LSHVSFVVFFMRPRGTAAARPRRAVETAAR